MPAASDDLIAQTWRRLKVWISARDPHMVGTLHDPVSPADLARAEATIGRALHPDHRALLEVHDGSAGCLLFDERELLTAGDVAYSWGLFREWQSSGELDRRATAVGPVRSVWWHPRWIPLLYDQAGNYHMLDFAPVPGGEPGQVITYWHDQPERTVVAPSLRVWLLRYVAAVEAGKFELEVDNLIRKTPR